MFCFRSSRKEQKDTAAIIVAAGSATRMGGIDKQFAPILGIPVLGRSMLALQACPSVCEIIVVTREEVIPLVKQLGEDLSVTKLRTIVTGGNSRQESVQKGLSCVSENAAYIAVHDGARPLLRPADAEKCIEAARETGAATLGVPVKDTIKLADEKSVITATPDRSHLWATHTPQVFERVRYEASAILARESGRDFTDDCQLLEFAGHPVTMVAGNYDNIKITTPEDLAVAEGLLLWREGREAAE